MFNFFGKSFIFQTHINFTILDQSSPRSKHVDNDYPEDDQNDQNMQELEVAMKNASCL